MRTRTHRPARRGRSTRQRRSPRWSTPRRPSTRRICRRRPPRTERLLPALRLGEPATGRRLPGSRRRQPVVGRTYVELPMHDNLDIGVLGIECHPDHRSGDLPDAAAPTPGWRELKAVGRTSVLVDAWRDGFWHDFYVAARLRGRLPVRPAAALDEPARLGRAGPAARRESRGLGRLRPGRGADPGPGRPDAGPARTCTRR